MSQTILYARVSTVDQTVAHQRKQAEAAGFEIDDMVMDEGVSGISTRLVDRPQGRRLFDMLRRGDILVVRWVDRLGRNYQNVTDTVREFMRRGVIIKTVINTLTFDGATQDPLANLTQILAGATPEQLAAVAGSLPDDPWTPNPGPQTQALTDRADAVMLAWHDRHLTVFKQKQRTSPAPQYAPDRDPYNGTEMPSPMGRAPEFYDIDPYA